MSFLSLAVSFQQAHWNSTLGTMQPAVIIQPGDVDTPPSWGLAQGMTTNTEGITGSDWVVASPVSVTAGIATFVFTYAGDPIAQYQTRQPNLWVEAAANQVGAAAIATVTAMHLNGDVSSDVAAGVAVLIVDDPIP